MKSLISLCAGSIIRNPPLFPVALFCCLFSGFSGTAQATFSEWLTSSAFQNYFKSQADTGLFSDTVEGKLENGVRQYRVDFVPAETTGNNFFFYAVHGWTDTAYSSTSTQLAALGMTLHASQTFTDISGETLHQAVWTMENIYYSAWMDANAYQAEFDLQSAAGYFPFNVETQNGVNGIEFRALFLPRPWPECGIVSVHGVSQADYNAVQAEMQARDFRSVNSTQFTDSSGDLLYNATWVQASGSETVEKWRELFFAGVTDPATLAMDADPDGDGTNNLLEYALGSSPIDSNSQATTRLKASEANPDEAIFSFTRPENLPGIDYSFETSADLDAWQTYTPPLNSISVESLDNLQEAVNVTMPVTSEQPLFMRLKVSKD